MSRLELTKTIAVPPERVFGCLVPQRMPYWYGKEMDACFEVQNGAWEFRRGLSVCIHGHLGKQAVGHTVVIVEYERPRVLEWHFTDAYGVTGSERWELSALPGQGTGGSIATMVTFTSMYRMPGMVGPLVDRLFTRYALAQRHRSYLEKLARLVEPRPAKGPSWRAATDSRKEERQEEDRRA